jgi:hypothetical protein
MDEITVQATYRNRGGMGVIDVSVAEDGDLVVVCLSFYKV